MVLTERVVRLRERALNWQEYQSIYHGQRLAPAMQALAACRPTTPWMMRKARMLAAVIRGFRPLVHADELLVGYNFAGGDDLQALEMWQAQPNEEERERLRAYLSRGLLTSEQVQATLESLDRLPAHIPAVPFAPERTEAAAQAEASGVFWCYGTPYNHTVIGYGRVLELGLERIAGEVRERLAELEVRLPADWQAALVLESALTVADAAVEIGERYAAEVEALQVACDDAARAEELGRIAVVLRQVPAKPARTLREALQSLWFAHILNTWEDGINANSLGRLDQILYPYYRRDIEAGRLTRDEAFELLCCLWIKLYRDYDVQQIALGGVDAEGRDATNELTYLMLDVTAALGFVRCLSVRLHQGSSERLLRRALELVGQGNGIPFFFNDEVLVPALVDRGIDLADARDYAAIGCVEITIPGKANPHAVSSRINLLKCLELALNEGKELMTGASIGAATAPVATMQGLEDVIAAYEQQAGFFVEAMCRETLRQQMHHRLCAPMPYKSLLTEGCISSGRDFNDSGARYDYHESMPMGIPNVADALAAVEQVVFNDRRITLPELVDEMRHDYPNELLRLTLLNRAPKFGNDDDRVDGLAARVFRHVCDLMREASVHFGVMLFPQPFTFLWLVEAGQRTAATPDGRRNGENLAYSISPMQGRDEKGLTALVNSLAKLPQHLAAGSTSAIIEVEPSLFGPENIEHLVTLLRTTILRGVGQLQFNVVTADTLRRAQADPERYRNLAVRVSGFSQKFCLLSEEIQEHIIARTKHRGL
jgi:pyruvate formate-lyase/glycerol dehydratase family glycyl radical enzyme